MSLLLASEEFLSSSFFVCISLHLVPTRLICPARETLLVAMLLSA